MDEDGKEPILDAIQDGGADVWVDVVVIMQRQVRQGASDPLIDSVMAVCWLL